MHGSAGAVSVAIIAPWGKKIVFKFCLSLSDVFSVFKGVIFNTRVTVNCCWLYSKHPWLLWESCCSHYLHQSVRAWCFQSRSSLVSILMPSNISAAQYKDVFHMTSELLFFHTLILYNLTSFLNVLKLNSYILHILWNKIKFCYTLEFKIYFWKFFVVCKEFMQTFSMNEIEPIVCLFWHWIVLKLVFRL